MSAAINVRDNALEIGKILSEIKAKTRHGEWLLWVGSSCPIPERTAYRYLSFFEDKKSLQSCQLASFFVDDKPVTSQKSEFQPPPPLEKETQNPIQAKKTDENLHKPLQDNEKTCHVASFSVDSQPLTKNGISIKGKADVMVDEKGFPIPDEALPFWNRRQEIQDMLTTLSQIRSKIEKALSEKDPMYGIVTNGILADLKSAYSHINQVKPYAVCTTCHGRPSLRKGGCGFCLGSGLISKFRYEVQATSEIRDIRERSVAK